MLEILLARERKEGETQKEKEDDFQYAAMSEGVDECKGVWCMCVRFTLNKCCRISQST